MESSAEESAATRFGIGTIVSHPLFGNGRVVGYESDGHVVLFKGGETKRVAFTFENMRPVETHGDPEIDRMAQAVREVLGDYGWLDVDLELGDRWVGGTIKMIPGKENTQPKEVPMDAFFKKIIGVREKLRVLEQKINNHPKLSPEDKVELEGYITRCYGSLTTFNALFSTKEGQFRGQAGGRDQ
jgi:hypothetical protein